MKTPHAFGRPLIGLIIILALVAILTVPRCGKAPQTIVLIDSVQNDSTKFVSTKTTEKKKKLKRRKDVIFSKERVVRQRDYLRERVDSVK